MSKRSADDALEPLGSKKMRASADAVEMLLGYQHADSDPVEEVVGNGHPGMVDDGGIDNTQTTSSRMDKPHEGLEDLYLDTIDRKRLDFDFEKVCSVTTVNNHIYACLVCGKYFAGRGVKTPMYFHSMDKDHHVAINLETKKIYVLPEGYEVITHSLDDIKYNLDPTFTKEQIANLNRVMAVKRDLNGDTFKPGYVGLQNLKDNDWFNAVMHALVHVGPLRDTFLSEGEKTGDATELARRFGILTRKIYNSRAFKAHVSPHELLQEVSLRTSNKFNFTEQADPYEFLMWLLNHLHYGLGGTTHISAGDPKTNRSIVSKLFCGKLRVESQAITTKEDEKDRLVFEDTPIKTSKINFVALPVDLPPRPLYEGGSHEVFLTDLLKKYTGSITVERNDKRQRYRLLHPLPPYLVMHFPRFVTNKNKREERNPYLVKTNLKALDMNKFTEPNAKLHKSGKPVLYDLIANITHEAVKMRDDSVAGEAAKKEFRVQLVEGEDIDNHPAWWLLRDMEVQPIRADLLMNAESYIHIWKKRTTDGTAGQNPSDVPTQLTSNSLPTTDGKVTCDTLNKKTAWKGYMGPGVAQAREKGRPM